MGERKKYHRMPKAKPGELRMKWSTVGEAAPGDIAYNWGAGIPKADSHLLHAAMYTPMFSRHGGKSFIQELEARGYDLTTISFYVRRKPTPTEPTP